MRRSRPRPRRGKQTVKSRLPQCAYRADPTLPDPRDPDHPLCVCGLALSHPRHTPADLPEVPEQAEHRRRYGDDG